MKGIRVFSPAKINLFLQVLGKRSDGFHEICTLMQMVDLRDEILLERRERGIHLRIYGRREGVPSDERNLAYRAARCWFQELAVPGGVAITLHKRIPSGGGLGGGSSNAAATLRGLCQLFEISTPGKHLRHLAVSLGSDVPFFLTSGCAIGEGRGEILKEVSMPSWPVVIIYPGFEVSTQWAYGRVKIKLTKKIKKNNMKRLIMGLSRAEYASFFNNDLEEVVFERYPLIGDLKDSLLDSGAQIALMSGSGSCVFGLFADGARAKEVARSWRNQDYLVHEGKTIGFNPIFEEER